MKNVWTEKCPERFFEFLKPIISNGFNPDIAHKDQVNAMKTGFEWLKSNVGLLLV